MDSSKITKDTIVDTFSKASCVMDRNGWIHVVKVMFEELDKEGKGHPDPNKPMMIFIPGDKKPIGWDEVFPPGKEQDPEDGHVVAFSDHVEDVCVFNQAYTGIEIMELPKIEFSDHRFFCYKHEVGMKVIK